MIYVYMRLWTTPVNVRYNMFHMLYAEQLHAARCSAAGVMMMMMMT